MTFLVAEMLGLLVLAALVGLVAGLVIGWGRGRRADPKPTATLTGDDEAPDFATIGEWYSTAPPEGSEERWAADVVALEAELATARNDLGMIMEERTDLRRKVDESAAGMKCQWEELVGARRRILELESSLVEADAEVAEVVARIGRVMEEVRSLESVVAAQEIELADRDATLSRLRSELFTRETELERMRSQGAAVGRQLVAFEREVPTLRQRAARADLDGSRATAHRREIDSKRRRLADLEHQMDDVVVLRDELVFVRQRESDLKSLVADSSITVRVLRNRVDELESEVARLRAGDGEPIPVPVERVDDGDLTRIRGIGTVLERMLANRGVTTLRDIASLDDDGIDQLQAQLTGFPGRIRRDGWVAQAQELLDRDRAMSPESPSSTDEVGGAPPA